MSTHTQRPKHVPQRTCVACRRIQGKRSLIRLVRTQDGVIVDTTGKAPGRGMYLHPNQECWKHALRTGRIEQALRTRISPENRRMLEACAITLPLDETLPGTPDFGATADTSTSSAIADNDSSAPPDPAVI